MAKRSFVLGLVLALAGPVFVSAAGTLPLSQTSVSLGVGQSFVITANNPTNARIYVVSISDAFVAYANVSNNVITVYGLVKGYSQVGLCSYDNYCNTVYVSVEDGTPTSMSFSRNNFTMNIGEVSSVGLSGGQQGYYIHSHANSSVTSAYISNSDLVITAKNAGSDEIIVCSNVSNACGRLYVNVSGTSLYFTNASPVPAYVGNYYAFQLGVAGGSAPYSFSLVSGILPAGLNLSANGLIYGTPSSNSESYFVVRAVDAAGRIATSQGYYLKPSGGVQGSLYYNKGTLVNDNGTIYVTYKNTKSGFANMGSFTGLGYKLSNVISGSTAGLANTNYVISVTTVSHPWGSWVKSGNTIYFMHESGLIPIPTYEIFLNNGGGINQVVDMNSYDLSRPMLPLMVMNDPRMK